MVGGWHRLLGQVVAVLGAQHSHCIYSCSELGPAAHLQSHVNSFILLGLVVMGLLYMASPNGCRHEHIPAQTMALPCEGGIGSCVLQSHVTPVVACMKASCGLHSIGLYALLVFENIHDQPVLHDGHQHVQLLTKAARSS